MDKRWPLVDKGIFFVRGDPNAPILKFLDFSTSSVKDISRLNKQPWPLWISASADGKFVFYEQLDVVVSNLMLLDNFR